MRWLHIKNISNQKQTLSQHYANKCGICKTNNCHNKHRTFYNRALNFVPLFSPQFPVFSLRGRTHRNVWCYNYIMLFSEEKSKCSSLENKCDFHIIIPNPNFPDGWKSPKISSRPFKTVAAYHMVSISRMLSRGASQCLTVYQFDV